MLISCFLSLFNDPSASGSRRRKPVRVEIAFAGRDKLSKKIFCCLFIFFTFFVSPYRAVCSRAEHLALGESPRRCPWRRVLSATINPSRSGLLLFLPTTAKGDPARALRPFPRPVRADRPPVSERRVRRDDREIQPRRAHSLAQRAEFSSAPERPLSARPRSGELLPLLPFPEAPRTLGSRPALLVISYFSPLFRRVVSASSHREHRRAR